MLAKNLIEYKNWSLSILAWKQFFKVSSGPARYQVVDDNIYSLNNYSSYVAHSRGNGAQLLSMALGYKTPFITSHFIENIMWKVNPARLLQSQSISCLCLEVAFTVSLYDFYKIDNTLYIF